MNTNVDSKTAEQDDSIPPELLALAEKAYNAFHDELAGKPRFHRRTFSSQPQAAINGWVAAAHAVSSAILEEIFGPAEEEKVASTKGCGNNCADCKCG